jgi:hypothetical protein
MNTMNEIKQHTRGISQGKNMQCFMLSRWMQRLWGGLILGTILLHAQFAGAASPYAGFYTGYVYSSISGTITVPESAIGAAAFTVDNDGNISGNMTGVVDGSGNITWNANETGFTTGTISGGVLASTTSRNNGGAITTFRIAANTTAGGFGGAGTVAQSLAWRRPFPSGAVMRGVTHGGGKFVAVGPAGGVAVSGDGTNWITAAPGMTQELNAVAHGNGVFVAVGDGASAISSTDGINWTARSIGGFQDFVGVAFGAGTFVAVNLVNAIYTSTDGISWTAIGTQPTGISFWNNLKYVGGRFVLVGALSTSGVISTSTDGVTWSAVKSLASTGGILDVAFGNGKWVGVNTSRAFTFTSADASDAAATSVSGLGDSVGFVNGTFVSDNRYFSTDGLTWKRETYPNLDINDMVTANGLLVAVGGAMTSTTDGRLWTVHSKFLPAATVNNTFSHSLSSGTVTGDVFDEILYHIQGVPRMVRLGVGGLRDERANTSSPYTNAISPTTRTLRDGYSFGSTTSFAVGDGGTIIRFGSGVNEWTNVASGTTADLRSIAGTSGNNVIVVGTGGVIRKSDNGGQTWAGVSSPTGQNLNRVAYFSASGFNYYIAVGDNGTILKSADGSSWSALNSGSSKRLVGAAHRTTGLVKLVVMAEDSSLLVSEDHGTTWRAVAVNAPVPITFLESGVAYGAGGLQMNTTDGTNWTYSLPNVSPEGVGHGNGRVIVTAGNLRLVSTDLENWTAVPVNASHKAIAFGAGLLVSVGFGTGVSGEGFVSTSVDGLRWVDRVVPVNVVLNSVAYGAGRFVAVGSSGTILSSADGITWINRTISGTQELRGITYGNGLFVAVGASGTTRYSSDGENWTSGSAGGTLNAVTHDNGLFVAVGDSGAIRTSANGTSWTSRSASPSTTRSLRAIRYAGGRFVAVGEQDGSGQGAVVVHSADGVTWTKEIANIPVTLLSASASSGQYVAVGSGGTLVTAPFQDADSPVITAQPSPANQTINAGGNATYTVTVTGSALQYRWLKDGVPLTDGAGVSGATTATLSLTGLDVLDAGDYRVSIWNGAGSALSIALTLTVNGPPIITVHPVSATTSNTLTTNFTVMAVGPGTPTYQWRKNGQPLSDGGHYSGVTTSKLTISSASGADEATYDVIVGNSFGNSAPSNGATLTVNRPPTITTPPVAVNITQGQIIPLSVVADGSSTLTYQWKRNGANLNNDGRITGATSANLVINSATVADAGNYTVTVTGPFNPATTSTAVFVSVLGPGALHPGFTFNGSGTVWDIAPTPDGKFVVVGDVSLTSSPFTWQRVLKVDAQGAPVMTFASTNSTHRPNSTIRSVAVLSDGRLVVGGDFWQWGGNSAYGYTVRLDAGGALDSSFQPNSAWPVRKVISLAGDKVLIGRSGNGFATSWVNRYGTSGALDGTFTEIANNARALEGLAVQSDGTIWLTGLFGLKKAAANGTSPTGVTTYAPFGEMNRVFVGPDNKVYYSDNNGQYLGRLHADGSRDTGFSVTINGHVQDMAFLDGGRMVIVGNFQTVNSVTTAYIAVLEDNGTLVTGFLSPYTWASGQTLYAIEMLGDGSALVGGTVQMTLPSVQRHLHRIQIGEPAVVGLTYAQWLADKGLDSGVNDGASQDADNDGVPNIGEFAFGTHPNQGGSVSKPIPFIVNDGGADYPAVRYQRNKLASGITIIVEASSDATFPGTVATTVLSPVDLGGDLEQIAVRGNTALDSITKIFFRVKISQP